MQDTKLNSNPKKHISLHYKTESHNLISKLPKDNPKARIKDRSMQHYKPESINLQLIRLNLNNFKSTPMN